VRAVAFFCAAGGALAVAPGALAENADYYRGGWRTETGDRQVYEFAIEGTRVSGVQCTRCSDGTTLARIEGSFDEASGIDFRVRHLKRDGSPGGVDHLKAKLVGTRLVITGGNPIRQDAIRDPRGPAPGGVPQIMLPPGSPKVAAVKPAGGGAGGPPPPYIQPAPWRQLGPRDVVGVWLGFGVGRDKQYFLIRNDGGTLFGLACGPCDNPYTMGALGNFTIKGDTLEFDIEHQDWGEGDRLPFARHVTAHIAMNEMRMDARRDDAPDRPGIVASLLGPIAIEATVGNRTGGEK
jgi:hypothetical protein